MLKCFQYLSLGKKGQKIIGGLTAVRGFVAHCCTLMTAGGSYSADNTKKGGWLWQSEKKLIICGFASPMPIIFPYF